MNVVLISTYELGHQPFGLTSAAAWLKRAGAEVTCQDAAVQHLDKDAAGRSGSHRLLRADAHGHAHRRAVHPHHQGAQSARARGVLWPLRADE